jgi:hypothetical protein
MSKNMTANAKSGKALILMFNNHKTFRSGRFLKDQLFKIRIACLFQPSQILSLIIL